MLTLWVTSDQWVDPQICQLQQPWLTLWSCNFANTGRFFTQPAPIDRPYQGLSIGTVFVKNRLVLTKLQDHKVNHGCWG